MNDIHAEILREHLHHILRFIQAQQAVIDKHAGELIANGAVNERRRHRRIHAAGKTQNHLIIADLRANLLDRFLNIIRHRPAWPRLANIQNKTIKQRLALLRMRNLRMKLNAIKMPGRIFHHGNRTRRRLANNTETLRQLRNLVAMTHPYIQRMRCLILNTAGKITIHRFHLRIAKLALVSRRNRAAQMMRHELHAITNTQHRHTQSKNTRISLIVRIINRIGPAGKNNALWLKSANLGKRHIIRMQFTIHMRLAHAAGNKLRYLRAKIEN